MPAMIKKNVKTKPAPELLLAQLILSAILVLVVGHATYEKDYEIPRYVLRIYKNTPYIQEEGKRSIPVNEFRSSYTALCLLMVSAAYFFTNLILYLTCKCTLELYNTWLILLQDMVFCFLMFVCSIGAASHPGERAIKWRETEILIASGISMFCCVSSGVVMFFGLCSATHGGGRVVVKPAASYSYPSSAYAYPPLPLPPATATTYRYDFRYNPLKYGYGSPSFPAAPLPPAVPLPQEYAVPYSWAAYAPAAPVPAVPAVPAYAPPAYSSSHAHHFIDRHLAAAAAAAAHRYHHHHHHH